MKEFNRETTKNHGTDPKKNITPQSMKLLNSCFCHFDHMECNGFN